MRYFVFSILILLSFFSCRQQLVESVLKKDTLPYNIHQINYPLKTVPGISAHRGGKYIPNYPENCLETFQHITKKYNLIIECDVAQLKDGTLVLMHDDKIDRTTSGRGHLSDKTWDEVKDLTLLDYHGSSTKFNIPLLADVLQWAKGNAILSLDIKKTVNREDLLTTLNNYKASAFAEIITYNYEAASYYQKHAPQYRLSVGMRNDQEIRNYMESDMDKSKLKPFAGTRRKDAGFYAKLHEKGLVVTLGTLGNLDEQAKARGFNIYDKLIEEGVDIFATDYPLEVAEYYFGD